MDFLGFGGSDYLVIDSLARWVLGRTWWVTTSLSRATQKKEHRAEKYDGKGGEI